MTKKRTYLIGLMVMLLVSSSVPFVFAALSVDASGGRYENDLVVSVSGGTANGVVQIMITNPSDELVWADQDNFDASGDFEWTLYIPNDWEDVKYTVTVLDPEAEVTDTDTFDPKPPSSGGYTPPPSTLPPPPTPPTPDELEDLDPEEAADEIEELEPEDAAEIIEDVNSTKAADILEETNSTKAAEIMEQTNSTKAAEILNEVEEDVAAEILLETTPAAGADIVEEMAKQNLNEAAKRVEAAVKARLKDVDPVKQKELLDKIADTLDNMDVDALVGVFVEIANLPETPSTVATVLEAMPMTKVLDVVSAWMVTEQYDELVTVYGYFTDSFLESVYLGMSTEQRTTIYPYLTTDLIAALPELGEFEVSDLSISPSSVETGDTVTITATVANIGDETGSYVVNLKIEGTTEETEQVSLGPSESEEFTWTVSEATAGTYSVDVNGETGSFTVTAPPPTPANIAYDDISVSPMAVMEGDTVTVTVTLENTGEESGSETVELKVDGTMVDSETVTVAGEDTETVTFTITAGETGVYSIEVGSLSDSYSVEAPVEPPSTFPWTWVFIGLVVVAIAAYYYYTQQQAAE